MNFVSGRKGRHRCRVSLFVSAQRPVSKETLELFTKEELTMLALPCIKQARRSFSVSSLYMHELQLTHVDNSYSYVMKL